MSHESGRDRQRHGELRGQREMIEKCALRKVGFEPTECELLWLKGCVWYGREAALQYARRVISEEEGDAAVDF